MNRRERRAMERAKRIKKKPSWKIGAPPAVATAWAAERAIGKAHLQPLAATAEDPFCKGLQLTAVEDN